MARFPWYLSIDGDIGSPVLHGAGKQVRLGFHPPPIDTKRLQQLLTQRHIAVTATLALMDVNHHALAIDVGGFQVAQLGAANASGVQRHQYGLVEEEAESGHILLDCARIELPVLKQMRLVLAQRLGAELVGWLVEVLSEV